MISVSIIVPVFNAEPFLREALDSLLAQTLQNIEIICVNDGSTDDSLRILQEYQNRDSRIRIADIVNQGIAVARNTGIAIAVGEYLMFADADDWVEPDFCDVPYHLAKQTGADIVSFNYCRSTEAWQRGRGQLWDSLPEERASNPGEDIIAAMLTQISVTSVTKLWLRSFWINNKIAYPDGLGAVEDQYVHWMGLLEAKRVINIDQALYHYRENLTSITNTGGIHWMDVVCLYAMIKKVLCETSRYDRFRTSFLYAKLTMFRLCYIKSNSKFHGEFARRILAALTADEWSVIRSGQLLPMHIRNFYLALDGNRCAKMIESAVTVCRVARARVKLLAKLGRYQ